MRKKARWLAPLAALTLATGTTVTWLATTPAGATQKNLSVFVADGTPGVNHTDVDATDNGSPGDPGDYFVENTPVLDHAGGTAIGHADTIVTLLTSSTGDVKCTVVLSGGDILFEGGFELAELGTGVTVPVTGGTGMYGRARGTATVVAGSGGNAITFDLNG